MHQRPEQAYQQKRYINGKHMKKFSLAHVTTDCESKQQDTIIHNITC